MNRTGAGDGRARRRALSVLSDHALVLEVRGGDPRAWDEFMVRFRAPLEEFMRRSRIPPAEWPVCVQEVIEDALVQLSDPKTRIPERISAYLIRTARNRYLVLKRRSQVSAKYAEMSETSGFEPVVRCLLSEATRRASGELNDDDSQLATRALARIGIRLRDAMSVEEQELMTWVSNRIPHRLIAEWIGASYAATTKRIWRLERRLKEVAERHRAAAAPDERREIDRFLRRVALGARSFQDDK